jgi:hypothetical protein
MTDVVGYLVAIMLISFLFSPVVLFLYVWFGFKVDNDNDGKDDAPYRWEK